MKWAVLLKYVLYLKLISLLSFMMLKCVMIFVQGFVLQHQVILFCLGETFTDQPPIYSPMDLPVNNRANAAGFDGSVPKPGLEVNLGLGLLESLYAHIIESAKVP